jgi:hypothetical protein
MLNQSLVNLTFEAELAFALMTTVRLRGFDAKPFAQSCDRSEFCFRILLVRTTLAGARTLRYARIVYFAANDSRAIAFLESLQTSLTARGLWAAGRSEQSYQG